MKPLSLLRHGTLCLGSLFVFSAVGALSPALIAQSQDNASVAEAARKAKDQKKASPKEALIITEETLTLRPASADTGEAPPAGTVINTTPVMPGAETPATPAPDDAKKASAPDTAPTPPAEPAKSTESSSSPTNAPADVASTAPVEPAKSPESSSPPSTDTAATAPATDEAQKAEEQAAEIAKTKEILAQTQLELDLAKRELVLQNDTYFSNPDYAHDFAGKARLDDQQKLIDDKLASVQELKDRLEKLIQEAGISPDAEQTPAPSAQ